MESVLPSVKERLRKANEYLAKKNGINPLNKSYQRKKEDIRYAWEHNIDYNDVPFHRKGKPIPEKDVQHPTVEEVEEMLGRSLRNKPHGYTSTGFAVINVITKKKYDSMNDVSREYRMCNSTVRKWIETKQMFRDNTYFEYL